MHVHDMYGVHVADASEHIDVLLQSPNKSPSKITPAPFSEEGYGIGLFTLKNKPLPPHTLHQVNHNMHLINEVISACADLDRKLHYMHSVHNEESMMRRPSRVDCGLSTLSLILLRKITLFLSA